MWQSVLSLETWAWLLREPKDFRIPHSLPESNQYPFNHERCWNVELVALGYCSHIPKDISWAVKNQSEHHGPFSECFDCQLLWWRHIFFFFACSEFFSSWNLKVDFLFGQTDWDSSLLLNLDVPRMTFHLWRDGHVMCMLISLNYRAPEWFIWGHLFPTPRWRLIKTCLSCPLLWVAVQQKRGTKLFEV